MANVTVTQIENVITANTTTNVIEVTQQETNVVISSRTVSDINLGNIITPIQSNSNITTTANVTAAFLHGDGSNITGLTTDIVTEGSNLYYTQARFDSAFAAKDTGDLTEGTNLYYTSDRANSNVTQHFADGVTTNIVTTGDMQVDSITATGDISTTANVSAGILQGSNVDVSNVVALNDIVSFGNANISLDISGNNLNITNNIDSSGHLTAGSGNISQNLTVGSLTVGGQANITFQDLDVNGNLEVFDNTVLRENLEVQGAQLSLGTPDGGTGNSYVYIDAIDGVDFPLLEWANASNGANSEFGSWTIGKGRLNVDPLNAGGFTWYEGNNTLQPHNLSLTGSMDALLVEGNAVITGNLQVQGNVDYVNVEDLLVKDSSITLAVGAPTATSANIIIDRSGTGGGINAYIKWDEVSNNWKFFDGSSIRDMPRSTTELAEGINLYYTQGRFDTAFSAKDTDDLTEGTTNKYYSTTLFNADFATKTTTDLTEGTNLYWTTDRGNTNSDAWLTTKTTTDLAEGTNLYYTDARSRAAISSTGNITYDANTGVIGESLTTTDIDEGDNLYFTTDRANTAIDDYVVGSENIDVASGVISLTNALGNVNSVASETDTALTLFGEGGIELNQKVDSSEGRIIDINTDGYSVAEATIPADFDVGTNVPSAFVALSVTAGSTTGYATDIFGGALGGLGDVAALRGPGFSTTLGTTDPIITTDLGSVPFPNAANIEAAFTTTGITSPFLGNPPLNGLANVSAGLYGQDKGWAVFEVATASYTTAFPANTYVTGMSGAVVTFSEPALVSGVKQLIFIPGMAQTSNTTVQLKYSSNVYSGGNSAVSTTDMYGRLQQYDLPETLSNVTFDAVSYGNTSTVSMSTLTSKNISDFEGNDESATRFKRGLLIGASTTPDVFSGRVDSSGASTLGVILENDGETFTGNNSPAPRFLINNYTGNLDDLTIYPTWATSGSTGNISLDLPQIKAGKFTFKAFRGEKSTADTANYVLQAGDVVGKLAWRPATTTGTGFQGVDEINTPAAITVDVGDANITTVANTYMHITTTPAPGTNLGYMRNNANSAVGANQQTNFTTKGGNVTIAAQTNGMISLAPTPDYGDASNATVWTRYPGSTHEYHRFMDVGFNDKTNKNGTLVVVQPASGTTTGSGGLGYDSKGNATLRLATHFSNTDAHYHWDINHNESTEALEINYPTGTALSITENTLSVNSNIDLSTNATINYDVAHAHLYKTANVTAVAADTAYAFDWTNNVNVESNALITVSDTSRLNFDRTGIYNVALQFQIRNDDNALRTAYIWLRKNGTDVPNSTSRLGVRPKGSATASYQMSTLEYQVDVAAGEYVEVMFAVDNTSGISIEYQAAQTTPYARPAVASAVLLIEPVGV